MEGNGQLRRKDTTKGPPLRILSLDGGGVRGYSMLIILQELMHRTYVEIEGRAPRRDQIPKPCEHFDLICGTGTGGLIAIMLGRLRLDLETCKFVYVHMTKKVFESDKTIGGIPFRPTLFKASKLEEAIKECVQLHTIFESEGNDGPPVVDEMGPISPLRPAPGIQRHASNASVVSFSAKSPSTYENKRPLFSRWGNANALLYDTRENRTKTAVTAIYQDSSKGDPPALLRSYDSRAEPAPEFNCTIWQAGRATSATGLAFKPIKIGQDVFIDEGAGQYNPAPIVLDEATVNEWPGREVGVFVSIGTGKRPPGTDHNQHLWYEGFLSDFAEARKKLVAKIEGCEDTHKYMVKEHLAKRGVNPDNYYRLNVEVGVGDFGMNEWNRLPNISTNTRRFLGKSEIQKMSLEAATKLSKIYRAKMRLEGRDPRTDLSHIPEAKPLAIELPAEVPPQPVRAAPRASYESGHENLSVQPLRLSPRTSEERRRKSPSAPATAAGSTTSISSTNNDDRFVVSAPTPSQYRTAGGQDKIAITSLDEYPRPKEPKVPPPQRQSPPPVPPKTPINDGPMSPQRNRIPPPYPLDDGPPPAVNMARKPEYSAR